MVSVCGRGGSCSRFGVAVQDFAKSWSSGLAFLAVIKSIDPSLVDMRKALLRAPRENLEEAFRTAHYSLGIPRLLEPEGDRSWLLCAATVTGAQVISEATFVDALVLW